MLRAERFHRLVGLASHLLPHIGRQLADVRPQLGFGALVLALLLLFLERRQSQR